jgi:hypothetical protein
MGILMATKRKPPSRVMRWLMKLVEKWQQRYYEGPEAPPRLGEELRLWLALNPDATRETIAGYCQVLLDAAYRDGFTRGYDWTERGWDKSGEDPEAIAETLSQDWSLAESNPRVRRILDNGYDPDDPLANVAAPDKRAFIAMLARGQDIRVLPRSIEYEDEP